MPARRLLLRDAVRIDRALDSTKAAIASVDVTNLRTIPITGSSKTAFDVLSVLVERAGMRSVLHALKEIQDGKT